MLESDNRGVVRQLAAVILKKIQFFKKMGCKAKKGRKWT